MIIWSPGMSLEDIEEKIIEKAYEHYSKNEEKTANALKISLEKLQEKIKKFADKQGEMNHTLEMEKQKYEEYLRRARGIHQPQNQEMRKPYEAYAPTPQDVEKKEIKKGKLID